LKKLNLKDLSDKNSSFRKKQEDSRGGFKREKEHTAKDTKKKDHYKKETNRNFKNDGKNQPKPSGIKKHKIKKLKIKLFRC
jgi:hypothetical protein